MGKEAESVSVVVNKELLQRRGAITHLWSKVFSTQTEVIPVVHSEELGIAAAVHVVVSAYVPINSSITS